MGTEINHFVLLNPPSIFVGILCFILFLIVIYGSFKSTRNLTGSGKRYVVISLHVLSFLLIISILFNPAYRKENYREDKKKLAVVVDKSWSMNLPANSDAGKRNEIVNKYLTQNEKELSQIEKDFNVEYYFFGGELEASSLDSILKNERFDNVTEIGETLKNLKVMKNRDELDIAILISDGADKEVSEKSLGEILESVDFPINTVSPVTRESLYDVWIDSIESNEVTFLRYPFSVEVSIVSNMEDSFKIPVSLYEDDKLVAIKEASFEKDSTKTNVSFEVTPLSLGRKIYTVSIPALSKELITENNQKSFFTDVIINKIRVLHVAGRPSWDVKFLRKTLKRNPNIDLVSFFILRDPSDLVFAADRELSLIPFPVNEIFSNELDTFDVVIFQDFYFQPYGIYGFHLNNLRDYVSKDGGAFLMIGGSNSFNGGNYGRTSVSEILPVELDYTPKTLSETISTQKFHPKLTEIGKIHPITRIIPNKEENERNWDAMPELEGLNIVQGLNQSAMPLLSTADGRPVFAVENIGNGKVGAFMSDSSWKWNFNQASGGNISPLYDKFWNRLFLWFVNDPELGDLKINTDKPVYNPGDTVKMEVATLESGSIGDNSRLVITLPDGQEQEIELKNISDNRFGGEFEAGENGIYKASIVPEGESRKYTELNRSETKFIVEPAENEVKGPTANNEILKIIASKSGGRFITTRDNLEKLDLDPSKKKTITGYKTKKLWDNPFIFLLIIGMLSSEWILRRRWGLK